MNRGHTRSLVLALIAAVQLLLQPLLSTSWCATANALGADCCCSPAPAPDSSPKLSTAPAGSPARTGCCSQDRDLEERTPERAPAREQLQPEEGCDCELSPDPLPGTPPEAAQSLRGGLAFAWAQRQRYALPARGETLARRAELRARAPGCARPKHLLHQVFLL